MKGSGGLPKSVARLSTGNVGEEGPKLSGE